MLSPLVFLRFGQFRFKSHRAAFTSALLLAMVLSAAAPIHAQLKATVHVDPSKSQAVLYTTSIGVSGDRWDAKAFDPATVKLLQDAGVTSLRFPGNNGIDALYHWSTGNVVNPYTNDRAPAFAPERKFPAIAPVIDQLGTALITVNYGSNLDGTGGGEPAEAAAWVAYVNGKPTNTQEIGKDSKGNDWKTVGYWASLRAATPLPTDDGFNALRLGHPEPLGIQLWTIGHEPWNNGFYGQAHTLGSDADNSGKYRESGSPEPDLHLGPVATSKDWGHHSENAKVGPQAYGAAVPAFVKAMKAVDPTILVGAALTLPISTSGDNSPNPMGKNWNAGVLKAACASMDFSAITMFEGKGAPPNFDINLDEDDLLRTARDPLDATKYFNVSALNHDYALLVTDLSEKYKKFCPAGHFPPLAITNIGIVPWLPAKNPEVAGLYTLDATATLVENGVYAVEWAPIHALSPFLFDYNNQPQPAYFGLKLLHQVARVGDTFVAASTPNDRLSVHAVKRRDGGLGVIFINKDPVQSITATVTVDGYNYAAKGTRYEWGKVTLEVGKGITETPMDGLGGTFSIVVPRHSITALVIPKS
ncbi:MAG: hypothetical protein ABSE44_09320 [Candidatus Sulfotelmatobacter sp.]|jgi:hypothetical protein